MAVPPVASAVPGRGEAVDGPLLEADHFFFFLTQAVLGFSKLAFIRVLSATEPTAVGGETWRACRQSSHFLLCLGSGRTAFAFAFALAFAAAAFAWSAALCSAFRAPAAVPSPSGTPWRGWAQALHQRRFRSSARP